MQPSKITYANSQYPDALREIAAAPKQLYVLGDLKAGPLVAVVGSRRPTDYGKQVTHQLATDLARAGVGIVSGLALGIDTIAHQAAVEAGGYTIAVQGNGLDKVYPHSNRGLGIKILESGGAIISEYDPGMPALKQNFPARNRIISGLSLAVIVTEADASSGSLITANFAVQQNRQVLAVPGNITSQRSAGPNNLLKLGAIPVTSASDVLAALDLESRALKARPAIAQSAEEAKLLELMDTGTTQSQQLIEGADMTASQFAYVISLMEITGKVRNLGAGIWVRR
ncbi:MAG TPA: DNA-processing protein DprA [Candidatus Saccharimonadales bacterium]|nr:DNA-processing protein DprA [Candidatus Saccharimonadales bacterium]